ncbi:helix-turn-helix domain-containing protein [Shouchella clausii]|uniref:AraC family transcriptional regulator n=1 Tax=Shouchella clausii TaxID=79880 RepID=A0A268S1U5_SHOCL|nr:AraC family transcriptional regulator [Shouchella clausii]PAD42861.1 AraC family transcriptional regulator [Bacillus sp. 7520-S]AST98312.1 AraC family transcriptional regulator [Shouchella clausii]MBU8595128.1 AraC family transcriptional regulator [Shouchella clausii]MCR1289078.1 AraC family transcriptional regulator [Shouchella clausii]MCY1106349.1 AraC family transcriptional regulator [Shouchella clausii]
MKKMYEHIEIDRKKLINLFIFQARTTERVIPMHFHSNMELIYCINGSLRVWHEGKVTTLMDKDMLFINSNVPHSTQSLTENRVLVLYFPESFFANEQVLIQLNTLEEQLDEQVLSNLRTLLMEIYNLHYSTGTYDYILAQSRIIELKYWLVRHFGQTTELSPATSRADRQKIQTILDFIKEHYTENISLAETARICGYSEAYLSRMFHEYTGQTFTEYKQILCLEKAIDLLDTTNKSLTEISYETGFPNVKSFRKVFKEVMGKTPYEYKKSTEMY